MEDGINEHEPLLSSEESGGRTNKTESSVSEAVKYGVQDEQEYAISDETHTTVSASCSLCHPFSVFHRYFVLVFICLVGVGEYFRVLLT